MPNQAQRNFSGGELAPALYGRTDLAKYMTGLRQCRNMMIQRSGGLVNRPGTEFIGEVKNSAVKVRLIPYDNEVSMIIELGNQYARFYKNGVRVSPVGAFDWDGISFYGPGSVVLRLGIYYWSKTTNFNHAPEVNPADWYPMTGTIFEIPTPYLTADLAALDYAQSSSTITLVHPSYAPMELVKTVANLDYAWTLTAVSIAPQVNPPTALGAAGGNPGVNTWWAVTTVDAGSAFQEESLPVMYNAINVVPSAGTPTNVSWTPPVIVPGVAIYNIYRSVDGVNFGLIGSSAVTAFSDTNMTADMLSRPPQARDILNGAGKYPSAVTYYQQRRIFANSNNEPEAVWASRIAQYNNFGISFPIQDDDAVTFKMSGKRANPVKHLFDLGRLIVFTAREEKLVEGDQAGILMPTAVNPRKLSANGSGILRPLEIDTSALYVQARGTKVRDLTQITDAAYAGTDLTVFSTHLFDGFTINDWDYAQNLNSIVWAARSDGIFLGLTYLREHNIWGWHRHDTDGVVENVCVVPEGTEDKVYFVVKRIINGATKRYVERQSSRYFTKIEETNFLDCSLFYDGRNTGATTLTLSGGVNWTYDEDLTLIASVGTFAAPDVGAVFVMQEIDAVTGAVLNTIRLTVKAFTDATHVVVNSSKTVPINLRNSARTTWSKAVSTFAGLSHLEGKNVAILGDGFVKASPNNAAQPIVTVVGGSVTIDKPAAVVRIGLAYISDVETLDLDTPSGTSRKSERGLVNRVLCSVEKTRGVWSGIDAPSNDLVDPLEGLVEFQPSAAEDADVPPALLTDTFEVGIDASYNNNGRIFLRQVDPLPWSLLAAIPGGYL